MRLTDASGHAYIGYIWAGAHAPGTRVPQSAACIDSFFLRKLKLNDG